MFYVLDHVRCPMLVLSTANPDGTPRRGVYWHDTEEDAGPVPQLKYTGANLLRVPANDGASWTVADLHDNARGAMIYIEVGEGANLIEVDNRLLRCKGFRDQLVAEMNAAAQAGTGTVTEEAASFDPADVNQDGTVTKQERKQHGQG